MYVIIRKIDRITGNEVCKFYHYNYFLTTKNRLKFFKITVTVL